jgi:hypothetical protein
MVEATREELAEAVKRAPKRDIEAIVVVRPMLMRSLPLIELRSKL